MFKLIVHNILGGLDFRSCCHSLTGVKKFVERANICSVNLQKVISCARAVVAWAFALAFDIGNKQNNSYLAIRCRILLKGKLENLHLLALPMLDKHTGENICDKVKEALEPICPEWRKKLIGLGTDGASAMIGKYTGAVTLLEKECKKSTSSPLLKTWCGLHQLDLIVKKQMKALYDEQYIDQLTTLSNYLRR